MEILKYFTELIKSPYVHTLSSPVIAWFAKTTLQASHEKIKDRRRIKKVTRDRFEQLKSFLAFGIKKSQPLVVEEQFKLIFGILIKYREIFYLLESDSPLEMFSMLKTARSYVEFNKDKNRFVFIKGYQTAKQRKWKRLFFLCIYIIFCFLFAIGMYSWKNKVNTWPNLISLIIYLSFIGYIAFVGLDIATDINCAERFISGQKDKINNHADSPHL